MTTEEILNEAQKEVNSEAENFLTRKAIKISVIIGVSLLIVMTLVERVVFAKYDFGKMATVFCMAGFLHFFDGKYNKSKKTFIKGIFELVLFGLSLLVYIGDYFV